MRVARVFSITLTLLVMLYSAQAEAGAPKSEAFEQEKKSLMKLGSYVGEWRGTGSTKESAGRDAWIEESEWGWDFKGDKPAMVFTTKGARYFASGKLMVGEKEGLYVLQVTPPDSKTPEEYKGEVNKEGELVLDAVKPDPKRPSRVNLSLVAKGKRLIMQYLKSPRQGRYEPVAEMGLTLKGSGFGKFDDPRECIITGGSGKITVSYQGVTYYVCCGGCKDAFDADPAKEIAQWKKRKEEEKKKM